MNILKKLNITKSANSKHLQTFPESLNGFSFGSVEHNHADWIVVQKAVVDNLHKDDKSQSSIAKKAECSPSAVSKPIYRKLSGRKRCGRKRYSNNGDNHSLDWVV